MGDFFRARSYLQVLSYLTTFKGPIKPVGELTCNIKSLCQIKPYTTFDNFIWNATLPTGLQFMGDEL